MPTPQSVAPMVARLLRRFADRIDRAHAPRAMSYTFTFERGRGIVFHGPDERVGGCPIWYLSDDDYAKAHTDAINQ